MWKWHVMAAVGDDGGTWGSRGLLPCFSEAMRSGLHHRGGRSELPGGCWPCVFRAHKGRPSTVAGDRVLSSFLVCLFPVEA